jgi:hypothetical protein
VRQEALIAQLLRAILLADKLAVTLAAPCIRRRAVPLIVVTHFAWTGIPAVHFSLRASSQRARSSAW